MGKYLITGRQGSGKTTVIKELQKRGYTAYNTDDLSDLTKLQDIKTGEVIAWPKGKPVDWGKYAWNWQKDALLKLLVSDKDVFVGAVTSNQEQFYPSFNKVFALILSPDNLRTRLEHHEHESHQLPGQIDRWVANHETKQKRFLEAGAVFIDANKSVEEVVDQILANVQLAV
jgi:broad-specificity NMP kinase